MKFIDYSTEVLADIDSRKMKAITENALILEREIASKTPVDTGHLRGSISTIAPLISTDGSGGCFFGKKGTKATECRSIVHPGGIEGSVDSNEAFVGTNVSYAPYVEYGTKYMKAQSFMRTGYESAKPKMDRNMERNMKI